jgi:broad specificity phosphatase PhoE
MSRHGESINNIKGVIGGDCHISKRGEKYRDFLGRYFKNVKITVLTSKLSRTKETAARITSNPIECGKLNEIHAGDFEGLYLDNIKANYPELYIKRNNDKVNNNYPNGENYKDVYNRVSDVLDTIKATDTILIIGHQAVCRAIYAYFTNTDLSECVNIDIDLHTIYELKGDKFISISSF